MNLSPRLAHLSMVLPGLAGWAAATEPPDPAHTPLRAVHCFAAGAPAADTFRAVFEERGAELAGVTHQYAASLDELDEVSGGGADRTLALPATVLVGPGRSLPVVVEHRAPASDAFDEFVREVARRTRTGAIDHYNLAKGSDLAIEGYDPVAYFNGRAERGRPELTSSFAGVRYRFATAENRMRFVERPWSYAPAYGGWCASAMGDGGRKVAVDPRNYKIKDGRLLLFYRSFLADARKDWDRHEGEWEPAADTHWQRISGESARAGVEGSR